MSRTRLIRPEFFADARISALPDSIRLFYVGLWTETDDAGFFEWHVRELAAALYPFRSVRARERLVEAALVRLVEEGRITRLDCEAHGVVPTIPDHRMKGGEQLFTIRKRHETRCSDVVLRRATSRISHTPTVSVSVSLDAQARETTTTRRLRDVALETGGFVGNLAGRKPA